MQLGYQRPTRGCRYRRQRREQSTEQRRRGRAELLSPGWMKLAPERGRNRRSVRGVVGIREPASLPTQPAHRSNRDCREFLFQDANYFRDLPPMIANRREETRCVQAGARDWRQARDRQRRYPDDSPLQARPSESVHPGRAFARPIRCQQDATNITPQSSARKSNKIHLVWRTKCCQQTPGPREAPTSRPTGITGG